LQGEDDARLETPGVVEGGGLRGGKRPVWLV